MPACLKSSFVRSHPEVVNKYQTAGAVANGPSLSVPSLACGRAGRFWMKRETFLISFPPALTGPVWVCGCEGVCTAAIAFVEAQCVPGKSVAELCAAGDELINKELAPKYKGKKVEKGIAFPTCLSLNNCCGHFSPLKEDSIDLKEGDVVKMCVCSLFSFFFIPHFRVSRRSIHEHNVHKNGSEVHKARDSMQGHSIQWHSIQWRWGDGATYIETIFARAQIPCRRGSGRQQ